MYYIWFLWQAEQDFYFHFLVLLRYEKSSKKLALNMKKIFVPDLPLLKNLFFGLIPDTQKSILG